MKTGKELYDLEQNSFYNGRPDCIKYVGKPFSVLREILSTNTMEPRMFEIEFEDGKRERVYPNEIGGNEPTTTLIEDENIQELLKHDMPFRYRLLGRLQSDCDNYLRRGNRNPSNLWAGNEKEQIEVMIAFWNSFADDEKPVWLTREQIENYKKEMLITSD